MSWSGTRKRLLALAGAGIAASAGRLAVARAGAPLLSRVSVDNGGRPFAGEPSSSPPSAVSRPRWWPGCASTSREVFAERLARISKRAEVERSVRDQSRTLADVSETGANNAIMPAA
jgi:hypothetical protein